MDGFDSKIGGNLEEIRELLNINQPVQSLGTDYAWYVGATGENSEGVYTDFSEQYIAEERWENGWDTKFTDVVKTIQVGDKIALKQIQFLMIRKKGFCQNVCNEVIKYIQLIVSFMEHLELEKHIQRQSMR